MKIGKKLGVSFGVIILLMAVIGGIGLLQLKKVNSNYQNKVLVTEDIRVKSMEIVTQWLEIRRSEKDFLARQDMKYFERGNEFLARMQEEIEAIRKMTRLEDLLPKLNRLEELNKEYEKGFVQLAELSEKRGLNENSGLQGTFRNAAHEIGAKMKNFDNENLQAALLELRRYEKDFVINRDNSGKAASYINKFKTAFADIQGLDKSNLSAEARASMNSSLAKYQAAMEKLFTGGSAGFTTEKYNVARDAAHEVEALLDERTLVGGAVLYLDIRKDEKDYMLRSDLKYVSGVEESIQLLKEKISSSVIPAGSKQQLIAAAEQYLADFKNMATADTEITAQLTEIKAASDTGMELAEEIEKQEMQASAAVVEQTTASSKNSSYLMGVVALVSILIGSVLSVFFARNISVPLGRTMNMIQELEKGHVDTRLKLVRKDEIGAMAQTMDAFADNLQHDIVKSMEKLAAGNLTFKIIPKDENDKFRGALKKACNDLNDILSQVLSSGEQVAYASNQVSGSSQSLSQGATEQASSLEEISSSLNEMASQTRLSAENANKANQLSNEAKVAAENGNQQMKAMVQAMSEINDSGQNISKIIKVIDEIAFQTNLLALNAAVEAARAGKHGKGFAVVAEEVRNLAARSAKAAKETAELIEGSVNKTGKGSQIANQTAEALEGIVHSINEVTNLVDEIATSSNEQAQGISQINEGLTQIDQVTQQNTANAEESAAAAEELSAQAQQLQALLSNFTLKNMPTMKKRYVPDYERQPLLTGKKKGNGDGKKFDWAADEGIPIEEISLDDKEFGKYSNNISA